MLKSLNVDVKQRQIFMSKFLLLRRWGDYWYAWTARDPSQGQMQDGVALQIHVPIGSGRLEKMSLK